MSENTNPQALEPTLRLLDRVNLHDTDKAKQFNSMLRNLSWELQAVVTLLWALDQILVQTSRDEIGTPEIFDRISRLVEMATNRATQLYDEQREATDMINGPAKQWFDHNCRTPQSAVPGSGPK